MLHSHMNEERNVQLKLNVGMGERNVHLKRTMTYNMLIEQHSRKKRTEEKTEIQPEGAEWKPCH